jgi:urease accessory protein
MTVVVRHQRSEGHVLLSMGADGVRRLREAQSAKVRMPQGSREAILINTGGGLAGGDSFAFDISAEANARLTVTSQAAERVYRALSVPAEVKVTLRADAGASLMWLPQETILYDGAALFRTLTADIAADARLLAVESIVLGREAMGEIVSHVQLRDRWRIRQAGRLIFADELALDGMPPASKAALDKARAFATIVFVSPDAENMIEQLRSRIGDAGDASAWSGKLVARLLARDSLELRKSLIPALSVLAGGMALPKVWSF